MNGRWYYINIRRDTTNYLCLNVWMNEWMNEWINDGFLLRCDQKLKASLVLHTRQLKEENGRTKT